MHIVDAKHNGGHFPLDYFPRKVYYKRDAEILAAEAWDHGCKDVTIDGNHSPPPCRIPEHVPIVTYRMAVYVREGLPESTIATSLVDGDETDGIAYIQKVMNMEFIRWA